MLTYVYGAATVILLAASTALAYVSDPHGAIVLAIVAAASGAATTTHTHGEQ